MEVSDPEIRKNLFGSRWQHEIDRQGWRFGKDSSIVSKPARFAGLRPKLKIEKVNEWHRLIASTMPAAAG